ncbi:class I SAM-dependent DNA methyltransferase [Bifidobacterium sp. UMB1230]|uniref:class I SAM-dependent DNA methyltransferase n=1 Tax=Gardnerella pickettii TaxID=2914924 RepID=UPI0031FCDD4F|nr:class I SAM-dependent DNA methyltransferase [Bifidobacterium sp. UMB1230]
MNIADQHKKAAEFIERWQGRGDEKQETQKFWLDFMQNVLDVPNAINNTEFEYRTAGGGYIDMLCTDSRFLVEQKSKNVDLDKPEERQGTLVTPAEQAVRYSDNLPLSKKPTFICTCNFNTFRFYDLEKDPRAQKSPVEEFTLDKLAEHLTVFRNIFSENRSRNYIEKQLSEKAGLLVANLHNELEKQYVDPNSEKEHHSLALITVRIVFCLYAEDAGLFTNHIFSNYIHNAQSSDLRRKLIDLFNTLDTKEKDRDKYLEDELQQFPYVNGGLFRENIEIPQLTESIKNAILHAGDDFDWHTISPVIFGSLMEETLSHDQRRKGGMHYTTVKNIHRLIDPLFLDDLTNELTKIETDQKISRKIRKSQLEKYQDKLASLQFLDPACGSGNFLTETFLCLRKLENRAIELMLGGQGYVDLGDNNSLIKVSIDQFHGIEINDFAVCVAKTALWIAEQQALDDTESIAGCALPHLPLHDSGNIVRANALQYDWNDLLSADKCSYVIGNPPFVGHQQRTKQIKQDLENVCGKSKSGDLDYVAGWYFKAVQYLRFNYSAKFAFVSTNSITQGQQVAPLFEYIKENGWNILFAHRTFAWNAQSTDNANVHVVIIGFTHVNNYTPKLYSYKKINGDPILTYPKRINGYLIDAQDVFVKARSQKQGPLSPNLSLANFGSMPLDGGNLLLNTREEYDEAMKDPIAAKYMRRFIGAKELINNKNRWCLWLLDAEPSEMRESKFISQRVNACKDFRENSVKTGDAYKNRNTPWIFRDNHQPDCPYLAIPATVSGRRTYYTCNLFDNNIISGNQIYVCSDPDGINFAIIESSMFMSWQDVIGGRLKNDNRFSNTVAWNNLPLPKLTNDMREKVIESGKAVLKARENHPGQSLADLYDPTYMPQDLRKAHDELDKIVDVAFGATNHCSNNDERLEILFKSYIRMTKE